MEFFVMFAIKHVIFFVYLLDMSSRYLGSPIALDSSSQLQKAITILDMFSIFLGYVCPICVLDILELLQI